MAEVIVQVLKVMRDGEIDICLCAKAGRFRCYVDQGVMRLRFLAAAAVDSR